MKYNGFVIAIRFNRSFAIVDNFGAIMDKLLYTNDPNFNNKVFPNYQAYLDARILYNKETDNKLTINSENFVLEINNFGNFEESLNKFLDSYKTIIIDEIFKQYEIKKINRFGCIIKSALNKENETFNSVSKIINKGDKKTESLSFRYNCITKKPKEIKGVAVSDYANEIVTYNKEKKDGKISFIVDYQHYFQPPLNKITDTAFCFTNFCKNSLKEFDDNYFKKDE